METSKDETNILTNLVTCFGVGGVIFGSILGLVGLTITYGEQACKTFLKFVIL